MLQIICDEVYCSKALEKIREILDMPGLLSVEKAQDIMELLRPLTLENEESEAARGGEHSLEELEREIFG